VPLGSILAYASQRACRMRSRSVALLLALAPLAAAAQVAPRSLSLELGITRDSAPALASRVPVALVATWWLAGDLDATARAGWSFAPRTEGRAADGSFEAGMGLRQAVARWGLLRPQLVGDVAFVQAGSPLFTAAAGVRVGAGVAIEAFVGRDLPVSLVAEASELLLTSGEGGPALSLALRVGACF